MPKLSDFDVRGVLIPALIQGNNAPAFNEAKKAFFCSRRLRLYSKIFSRKLMSKKRRVVITGMGVLAANAIGKDDFWSAIREGKNGIGLIERFDTGPFPTKMGGEVKGFNPEDYIEKRQVKRMDRTAHLAIAASRMAVEDAKIHLNSKHAQRTGVIIGTSMGGTGYLLEQHINFLNSLRNLTSIFSGIIKLPPRLITIVFFFIF